jgi:hypothetical protein
VRLRGTIVAVALAGLASTAGCDKGGSAPDQHPDDGKELAETRQKIDHIVKRLTSIYERTPEPAKAEEEACTAAELGLDGGVGQLAIGEHRYLARYAHPERESYAGAEARWKELTTPSLRVVTPSARATNKQQAIDALWNAKKLMREITHLGVLRAAVREAPKLNGEHFTGGKYSGILVVFDLEKAQPLCQAKVEAGSSTEVAGSIDSQDPEAALWNDFASNLRDAVHAAAKRVAPDLNLAL